MLFGDILKDVAYPHAIVELLHPGNRPQCKWVDAVFSCLGAPHLIPERGACHLVGEHIQGIAWADPSVELLACGAFIGSTRESAGIEHGSCRGWCWRDRRCERWCRAGGWRRAGNWCRAGGRCGACGWCGTRSGLGCLRYRCCPARTRASLPSRTTDRTAADHQEQGHNTDAKLAPLALLIKPGEKTLEHDVPL